MNEDSNKILMFGLPESGKTSFLAALAYYAGAQVPNKRLSEYKLSSNTAYINTIVQQWLSGQKQERTKIVAATESSTVVELYLEEASTANRFTLHIPDFFGEIFENQFFDRLVETKYLDEIRLSKGLILFVHPEKIEFPVLIEDVQQAKKLANLVNLQIGGQEENDETGVTAPDFEVNVSAEVASAENNIQPFNLEEIPTQVILVDLLEAHLEYRALTPISIAVVISAWDLVKKDMPELTPEGWVETFIPLLSQYLKTNVEAVRYKIFGVSALGGDIERPEEVDRLTALSEPAKRVLVQESNEMDFNITLPIEWILKQWKSTTT